jgi:hypothetical protein
MGNWIPFASDRYETGINCIKALLIMTNLQ